MKNLIRTSITAILLIALLPVGLRAEKYKIMRLTTPTINVGGKPKKIGDIIEDAKAIGWVDNNQSVEVKNMSTGAIHRFSKKVFESHGGIVSIKDYFISINKASTRDDATDIIVTRSTAKEKFPERRLALVIGNSNYNNLSYLRNAQKDASDVANTLLELGFDVIESYECSSAQLRTALNRFASMANDYDMILFYYAGHGLQEKGKNYLLPIESKLEYLSELDRTLNCDDVVQRMEATNTKSRLIVLDACRNAKKSWTRDVTEGLARMEGGAGSVILFSTQSGKRAFDGEDDNSPFAIAFLNNIIKPDVEFPMTMTSVVKDTYRMTQSKQSPFRVGDLMEDFIFNPVDKKMPAKATTNVASAASTASPSPASTPAAPAIPEPKVSMTSDELDVKVESCQLRNGAAYIDLRLLNTTRSDMRASIGKKDLAGTSAVYLYGGLIRNFDDLTVTGGGRNKQYGAIGNILLPSGLPVKLSIKVPNVYSDAKGIARLTLAFRGVDSSNSYGTALLSISDIPFGYKDPMASIIEDTQARLYFDVDGLDVQVTKAKRTGNKVKFDLILTNNTYSTMRANISDGWWNNAITAIYDTDGVSYSTQDYSRKLKFMQGNKTIYSSFELPSGIPIRITAIVTDYNPTDKVIPVFTIHFRGVDSTNYYGDAILKITNITIE